MTKHISPEQREEIQKRNELRKIVPIGQPFSRKVLDDVDALLSSEKAWREKNKKADTLIKLWVDAYNGHEGTVEEKEFIHVFRRILIEHHMNYSSLSQKGGNHET